MQKLGRSMSRPGKFGEIFQDLKDGQRKELLGKTSDPRANTGLLAAIIPKAKKHLGGPNEITDLVIEIDSISYQS